ncbi:hypothetical protein GPJ56_005946 [Histomonas meleagridis]|nr:hypothetical protein GPJ56_005946 [Histomonas meleagridis]
MMMIGTVLGAAGLGISIGTIYCVILYDNEFETIGSMFLLVFPILYVFGLVVSIVFPLSQEPENVPYHRFIGKGYYTLSELADKIAEVRTAPPIYKVSQFDNKKFIQNLEYVSWEEYEEFVSIPTKKPVCVIFDIYVEASQAMTEESIRCSDSPTKLEGYVNVNTEPLIVTFHLLLSLSDKAIHESNLFCS